MTAVEFPGAAQGKRTGMVVCAWIATDGTPHRESYPEIALEVLVSEERMNAAEGMRERVRALFENTE
jgi:hypothetical protein